MTIFFTGCTHFDHANIIPLAKRPFADVDEMNETLVERWNARVRPNDTVYHLGDFAYKRHYDWSKRLNGRIEFVLGNHDDEREFKFCDFSYQIYRKIRHEKRRFVLFHYPIEDWDGRWRGYIHLHAHTHGKELRRPSIPRPKDSDLDFTGQEDREALPRNYPPELKCNRFCVGVDSTGFAPISVDEILEESLK